MDLRFLLLFLGLITSILPFASDARADPAALDVTVSYRERIALPPDAELDVQLVDVSRAETPSARIASQRFAMTGVPMTVSLTYDPQIIDTQARYAVRASIWSGNQQLFRTTGRKGVLEGLEPAPVELLLSAVPEPGDIIAPPRKISGIVWAVTEIGGEAWPNEDPARLVIDDEMNFSIFGGCNRFRGQLFLSDGEIAFPENFAGTLMACPDAVEADERRFLAMLQQGSRYVRYGAGLVMTDAEGNALLHFGEGPE